MTPAIILFGIFSGVISPTESAAIAAVWSLFLGFVVHKEMTLKDLYRIAKRTVVSSAAVLMMISASSILTWLVISSGAPRQFAAALTAISSNRYVLLLLINILLLVMGCFLDATAIITIMVPMLLPIAEMIGIDLVAFGVIVVLNAMIGLITPPVGMCLSVTADIAGLPVSRVVKPMLVFAIPLVVVLILITVFPQIVTFLPDLLMGK